MEGNAPERKRAHYKQLTFTDRLNIEKWRREGMRPARIAEKLRVCRSTITRELRRGTYERLDSETWEMEVAYSPEIAEKKYQDYLRAKGPGLKIGNNHKLAEYLERTIIEKDCSPAVALIYAKEEKDEQGNRVFTDEEIFSAPTFYSYLHKDVFLNLTMKDLPRHDQHKTKYQHVAKKKPGRAPAGESIEKRPEEINERKTFGHWEMDTVYSAKKTGKACLLMMTERYTRYELVVKIPNRTAEAIVKVINGLEREWGKDFRKVFQSITVDNGSEFALTDQIEQSCIEKGEKRTKLYYCHPYSSWERGTNENQNGFARRKHPKGTNFSKVSKAELAETEKWMNNYPRKILGWKTSKAMFDECLSELGISA